MTQLILASASEGRKKLLSYLKIPFEIIPSTINEEKIMEKTALETIKLRAKLKGENVFDKLLKNPSAYYILSADSGIIINNQLIGKPKDYQEAKEIFKTLSGKTHEFVTAVYIIKKSKVKSQKSTLNQNKYGSGLPRTVLRSGTGAKCKIQKEEKWQDYEKSWVTFRKLTPKDIKRYLSVINYTKYAGGYAISSSQDFITKIEGSISNVIGLPLEKVIPVLKKNKLF